MRGAGVMMRGAGMMMRGAGVMMRGAGMMVRGAGGSAEHLLARTDVVGFIAGGVGVDADFGSAGVGALIIVDCVALFACLAGVVDSGVA